MALVQWKQINPELSGYGQLTGSLEISGSLILNGSELNISGGVVSTDQTLSINGYELSISNGNTVTLPSASSVDTSTLIVSASGAGNILTFHYGDGSTIDVTVDTGSGTGEATDISALNAFTSSIQGEVDSLTASTASYLTALPSDLISSSNQIEALGFITSSEAADLSNLNAFTSSADSRLDALEAATSSYTTGAHTDITSLNAFTASYEVDSASFDSRINAINVSGDTSFNGDRVVSNTLLGDLYTDSFNAGTTGSIQDFLTAVFFPSAAPTATFTEQTAYFNTNLATTGTNLNSISITDTVDDSPYVVTLGGVDAASFTAFPTNADSSSWEIQAATNLSAATYTYDVTVTDNAGATRTYSNKTITIAQASAGTLTPTGTFYIIESATTGPIYLNSSGRTGAQGGVTVNYSPNYGAQVASGFTSSNPYIAINATTGLLSVGTSISGSGNIEGTILNSDISWTDQYGNTNTAPINVQVTRNNAPDIVFTNTSNQNTNLATSGSNFVTLTFSDTEGDAIDYTSFGLTESTGNFEAVQVGNSFQIKSLTNIPAGQYSITGSIRDVHGFNTNTESHAFTVAQADDGTLFGDTSIYIIESALSGSVFRDATGHNNGNPAQVFVSYSPNYGGQTPTYTSSNSAIDINSNGYLTLAVDLSGSITQSGDTFNSTISWTDQYGNTDSSVVTATVFANQAPAASFTDNNLNSDQAIIGANIASVSISDTESNSPYSLSIAGTDGALFNAIPQNAASSSWNIQPVSNLTDGTYSISVTVTDTYSKQATLNETITVTPAVTDTLFIYNVGQISTNYNNDVGIQSEISGLPPVAASYSGYGFLEQIVDGYLGSSSFTYDWGGTKTATLLATGSGANVNDILVSLGAISKTDSNRFVILMPSGSNMTGVPKSMTNGYGGTTVDQYVLEVAVDGAAIGSGLGTTEDSNIHKVIMSSPVNGTQNYIMVGPENQVASSTSIELRIIPSSGSAV